MAIYQFNLTAIPQKSVAIKYGYMPDKLTVNYEERKEHYYKTQKGELKEEDVYVDALTQDWWSSVEIDGAEIVSTIDQYVDRADWGNNTDSFYWKTYRQDLDNDASLSLNKNTGKIKKLNFRADLREKGLIFLNNMIALSRKYNWLLMDVKGNLVRPEKEEIIHIIEISDNFQYVSNPKKYFEDFIHGRFKKDED